MMKASTTAVAAKSCAAALVLFSAGQWGPAALAEARSGKSDIAALEQQFREFGRHVRMRVEARIHPAQVMAVELSDESADFFQETRGTFRTKPRRDT